MDRATLKLPEEIKNQPATACAELLALRGQKFDENRPLCTYTVRENRRSSSTEMRRSYIDCTLGNSGTKKFGN